MRTITHYAADKGSCVINGVGFSNGYGDGEFNVYFSRKVPEGYTKYENVWFDLRDENLKIWEHDCNKNKYQVFTKENLGCNAVELYYHSGDICLVKIF